MSSGPIRGAWLAAILVTQIVSLASADPAPSAVPLLPDPRAAHPPVKATTKCAACHTPEGWHDVQAFPHERTGFPLRGEHANVRCVACHPEGFTRAVSSQCAACHRDVHAGAFGSRCGACHEERSWQPLFTVDAHRRTNFPLVGAHAALPCEQCHADAAERAFARPTLACVSCHAADYGRTATTGIDHAKQGFSTDCYQCHASWSFLGATFPGHESCFQIGGGPHLGITCRECHSTVTFATTPGTCATNNAACTGCHEHACVTSDARHTEVAGYQCKDRKCYECHRFVAR